MLDEIEGAMQHAPQPLRHVGASFIPPECARIRIRSQSEL